MINTLPDHFVVGVDCLFRHNSPVNPETWETFKRFKETIKITRKPMIFSNDVIGKYFNEVITIFGEEVLRDAEFSFVKHMREEGFKLEFDVARDSWIVNL